MSRSYRRLMKQAPYIMCELTKPPSASASIIFPSVVHMHLGCQSICVNTQVRFFARFHTHIDEFQDETDIKSDYIVIMTAINSEAK